MNGSDPKIEIFRPFGEAFELMKKILFQPFDLKKWLIIGFAAFLAGRFAGIGFSLPIPPFGNQHTATGQPNPVTTVPPEWKPWMMLIILAISLFVVAFVLVLMWLRARGNFIFTDCIVHNRAAIVAPWREFRKQGNSYFLFTLAVTFIVFAALGVVALAIVIPLIAANYQPHGRAVVLIICGAVILSLAYILVAIAFAIISYFMIPIMYIRRCRAMEAFRASATLIWNNLGVFTLFFLFGVVLLMGLMFGGTIVTCATCCLAALPYVGTVILLPAFVWLRAFGLLFLRQFGPDYDVWQGIVPPVPEPPPSLSPATD